MFNEIRMFEDAPVRVWAKDRDGRFVIWADGLMRWFPNAMIEKMPLAADQQMAEAFPVQDIVANA